MCIVRLIEKVFNRNVELILLNEKLEALTFVVFSNLRGKDLRFILGQGIEVTFDVQHLRKSVF